MKRTWLALLLFTAPLAAQPPAPPPAPTPEQRARVVLNALLDMTEKRALQFGNYRESLALIRFHRKVCAGAGADLQRRLNRWESIALMGSGQWLEAERTCALYQGQSPAILGLLHALCLTQLGRSQAARAQLAELARLQGKKLAGLNAFLVDSMEFRLDWWEGKLGEPRMAAQRLRQALGHLKTYSSARENTTGEGWGLGYGLSLWEQPLLQLIHQESGDPQQRAELIQVYGEAQATLHKLAQDNLTLKNLNPEFDFAVLDSLLTTHEDFLAYCYFAEAERQKREIRELLAELEPTVRRASEGFAKDLQELDGMVRPVVEGISFQGQSYSSQLMQVHLREGQMARIQARYKRIQIRSYWNLQEGPLERSLAQEVRQLLDEALQEQHFLEFSGFYPGLEDLRFDEVEWLLRQQEPGWAQRAELLLSPLLAEATRQECLPAQIQALLLRARLHLTQGSLEQAQAEVEEAEQLSQALPHPTDSALHLLERRRQNSLLGRLQSEIRARQGDVEGLLTGQERLRQAESRLTWGCQSEPAPSASSPPPPRLESLVQLRSLIPEGTAVVFYLPMASELRIFVMHSEGVVVCHSPVGREQLFSAIRKYRQTLVGQALRSPEKVQDREFWSSPAAQDLVSQSRQLYQWLIGPIAGEIGPDTTLATVGGGMLNYLPFSTLVGPGGRQGELPPFLARAKICVNLVGMGDLLRLSRPLSQGTPTLLALGDPDGSLPEARKEVSSIADCFAQPQVLVGNKARREALPWSSQSPNFLHIATHGNLDSSYPRASYLLLAGGDERSRLRIPDIYGLPLQGTDLVVLSACQTALGEVEPGSEVTSLADAFLVAGSRAVVASLWSVADSSTRQFMQVFYQQRRSQTCGMAFQAAQRELMQQPRTSHPFFWAPFVLIGDFR